MKTFIYLSFIFPLYCFPCQLLLGYEALGTLGRSSLDVPRGCILESTGGEKSTPILCISLFPLISAHYAFCSFPLSRSKT